MSKFETFAEQVRSQFNLMAMGELFVVNVSKDDAWNLYLDSFPEGTNNIYKERREYDCNTCKQFIKRIANVVSIVDGKLVSVWDVAAEDYYGIVANKMSEYIKSAEIRTKFLYNESKIAVAQNHSQLEDGSVKTWNHFSCVLPARFVDADYPTKLSAVESTKGVFQRGLTELSISAIDTVLDFINSGSIYRGDEFKAIVEKFKETKVKYDAITDNQMKNIFVWENVSSSVARIKNTVIGTLIQDISEGMEIERAVASFETKVAPANYKRTAGIITKGMIDSAMATFKELDIEASTHRRYARIEDVSINNVLFADRSVSPLMKDSISSLLMAEVKAPKIDESKLEAISIEDFIANVVPKSTAIEVMVVNKHQTNLMSIIAPVDPEAKNILAWNNNFSWGYNGDVTDSMKENVKKAGGKVEGDLRFSIQWNERNDNGDDLDAYCRMPNGGTVSYSNKQGILDVDYRYPKPNEIAVENILFKDKTKILEGDYVFYVVNYEHKGGRNFTAEIEFDGRILSYSYEGPLKTSARVDIATINYSRKNGFTIVKTRENSESSVNVWGVETGKFAKVTSMMMSPNFWDEQTVGNKHYFFILDDCKNPNSCRGLYNEFLKSELTPHRKVFDVIATKLMCSPSDNQLSGLGFSSTKRDELIVKVTGAITKMYSVKF